MIWIMLQLASQKACGRHQMEMGNNFLPGLTFVSKEISLADTEHRVTSAGTLWEHRVTAPYNEQLTICNTVTPVHSKPG